MNTTAPIKLEEILIQKGLLTADQLEPLKLESVNTDTSLEELILKNKLVPSVDMAKAKGELYKISFTPLQDLFIPAEVLDLVPEPTARRLRVLPLAIKGEGVDVVMADPVDLQAIEFLEKSLNKKVVPLISSWELISQAINSQYGRRIGVEVTEALEEAGVTTAKITEQIKDIEKVNEVLRDAPVARIVGALLEYAVKAKASDIHIEPQEDRTRVRYRIDGILQEKLTLPKGVHDSVIARIKILSNLKIDERRLPQDGRFKVEVGETKTDLRVSTLPTVNGEKVVIRLLKEQAKVLTFKDLGLWGTSLKRIEEALLKPHGIVLVTGPTGSGKTVTLATALAKLNTVRVNIVTLEDPVEIRVAGVNQVQINPAAGLTFASGLRSFLRQDPNVIMVGEIRDAETAELAIHAALTGHLVLSTLHTNSAAGALPRLLDMDAEPFLLASTVNLILAQRLCRRICDKCKEELEVPAEMVTDVKETLGSLFEEFAKDRLKDGKLVLWRGKGCELCGNLGYVSRLGIFEVMPITDKISRMVLERKPSSEIDVLAREEGMITLKQDGFIKALQGITTLEEVLRVARE
ncbi:MAG: ATPase, T2SS/T4P/T4SS family [bacterium]|nr:ATPase, T2SS/T4P/T4SS family [bacterium]